MDQLLPYYESELAYLRHNLREFAERYPRIAGRLSMSGEVCEDPHTERMIQSFAFLNARIARRLDDDYPEFTEALFDVLYPHYLRPFPSCSIAQHRRRCRHRPADRRDDDRARRRTSTRAPCAAWNARFAPCIR